jgi:hypothetical protein
MGFLEQKTNIAFLEQYAGDLSRVVFMISHGTLKLSSSGNCGGGVSVCNTNLITTEITKEAAARGATTSQGTEELRRANGRKLWKASEWTGRAADGTITLPREGNNFDEDEDASQGGVTFSV